MGQLILRIIFGNWNSHRKTSIWLICYLEVMK